MLYEIFSVKTSQCGGVTIVFVGDCCVYIYCVKPIVIRLQVKTIQKK